jgi:hypothetical protein
MFASFDSAPVVDSKIRDPDAYKSTFRIRRVLKGDDELGEQRTARVLFFPGKLAQRGDLYLVYGNEVENDEGTGMEIKWTTAIAVNSRSIQYVNAMLGFPEEGTERLLFARDYLTDEEEMLRRDAYDEFARSGAGRTGGSNCRRRHAPRNAAALFHAVERLRSTAGPADD